MARSTGIVVTLALLAALLFLGQAAGAAEQGELEDSISDGLAWLALQQNADGSWGPEPSVDPEGAISYGDRVARTGLAVMAFIDYAGKIGVPYDDPSYPYSDEIQAGIGFLIDSAALTPDGSIWDAYNLGTEAYGFKVYETSIAVLALTAAGTPDAIAWTEPDGTPDGKVVTYQDVVQDAVDYLVSAQNVDPDGGDGGWSGMEAGGSGDSDQLNTNFAAMALDAARDSSSFAIDVPDEVFVSSSEYLALADWVSATQADSGGAYNQLPIGNADMLTTGHLLSEMSLTGAAAADVNDAITFMSDNWEDSYIPGGGWQVNYPAIYATMIGFTSQGITVIPDNGIDWFDEMSTAIIANRIEVDESQAYWNDGYEGLILWGDEIFDTELALLTLLEWKPIAVGAAPTAIGDTYSTPEDTILSVVAPDGVLGNDEDTDGETLTAILVSYLGNGVLILNQDGSFSYTPESNFVGTDTFTYVAYDNVESSNEATVTITVTAVNDAPVAVEDTYGTVEDTTLTVAAPGVLANDLDTEGDALMAIPVSSPGKGTLLLNVDGSFTYTPDADFCGTDTLTYKANDGQTDSGIAPVTITVSSVNDAPVAVDDAYAGYQNEPLTLPVLANDYDVDSASLTSVAVSDPSHGTLALNPDGSFTYTPDAAFFGTDSFTYRANDGSLESNIATAIITVTGVVFVDIKPGSCPNAFNLRDKGAVSVAIVGTPDLDVSLIDPATVTLDGLPALKNRWEIEDVATPYTGTNPVPRDNCHELEGDGIMDLTVKFSHVDLAEYLMNTYGNNLEDAVIYLTLKGNLKPEYGGWAFEGSDHVWIAE